MSVIVAIPRMGELVAPCFEYCSTMSIFSIDHDRIEAQRDIPLQSGDPFDRVRLLRDQGVNTVICGGMQDVYEDLLVASGFQVISWVSGPVESLVDMFLRGCLVKGTKLQGEIGSDRPEGGPTKEG